MASPLLKAAQGAIKAATALGATTTATLRRTSSSYDPATGMNTTTTTDYSWVGVLEKQTTGSPDGSVIAGDLTFVGAANDVSVTPDAETDKLIVGGVSYSIVPSGLATDPAGATWTVQVRR